MASPSSLLSAALARFGHAGPGLPDPDAISSRKEALADEVRHKLREGTDALAQQHKRQLEQLHEVFNQQKMRFKLAMDGQVKTEEYALSQHFNEQLMHLQQNAQKRRAALEQQATNLVLEFQQKKVQEEFLVQQRDIQKQHQDAQKRLAEELQKLYGGQAPPAGFAAPQLPGSPMEALLPTSRSFAALPSGAPAYAAPPQPAAACPQPGRILQYVPPRARSPSFHNGTPQGVLMSPTPRSMSWTSRGRSPSPRSRSFGSPRMAAAVPMANGISFNYAA